ncbi:iron-containing alcohol dehydrogenase [soil metagenome]
MALRKLTYPSFRQPSQVMFGTGSVRALAQPGVLERAVLLLSGDANVHRTLARAFDNRGMALDSSRILHKTAGEPTAASITAAAAWLSQKPFDTLIAVGGGSVLDWARLSLAASRAWFDVNAGRLLPEIEPDERPRLILVPTTCGSGAEAAAVAVYTREGRKVPIVSDAFLGNLVVLDGQFLAPAPPAALASWVSDALSHAVEAFVSIVPNALAKHAAVGALQAILQHYGAPDPHCRHERLMEAGYLGGVAASNCSVGVVHAFAHTVSSHGAPHGLANALGLMAGIAVNADTSEMRDLLDRLNFSSVEALQDAVRPITSEAQSAGIPARLRDVLHDPSEREAIAARMATDVCLRSNPRRLDRDGLMAFLDHVADGVARV